MLNREVSRLLTQGPTESAGVWRARYLLDEEFVGFSGHFPEYPILPAFIQVELAMHLLRTALGENLHLSGIGTAKFTAQARPGDCLEVTCAPAPAAAETVQAGGEPPRRVHWDCTIRTCPRPLSFCGEPPRSEELSGRANPSQIAKFRLTLAHSANQHEI